MAQCEGVLITGSTGFLGIHILERVIIDTQYTAYCLVRGNEAGEIEVRFKQLLNFYFGGKMVELLGKRIILVQGDFTEENFGMDLEHYQSLGNAVNCVLHCGAIVKHFGLYKEFERVNVKGTEQVIRFARAYDVYMTYMSTTAAARLDTAIPGDSSFSEKSIRLKSAGHSDTYIRSKIAAEEAVYRAKIQGLRGSIFRIGALTGRYSDGVFQYNMKDNAVYSRIQVVLASGTLPEKMLYDSIEFTPVDYCSQAIVKLLMDRPDDIFHLANDRTVTFRQLFDMLKEINIYAETVPDVEFSEYSERLKDFSLRDELYVGFYLHLKRNANPAHKLPLSYDYTKSCLEKKEFAWPEINVQYIEKVVNDIKRKRYMI